MSSFGLFAAGYIVLMAGIIYAAVLFDIPREWIIAGGLVLLGLGVMKAVSKTKPRDPIDSH
ncbi:MAG: hypothetical protein ABWZ40_08775 [Caulobacterales bacterium]